jgi:predicted nucleic acid-binding Zn ribbon protein
MRDRLSASRRRGPRELSHAIAQIRRRIAPPTLLARVQEQWSEAVGAPVCDEALPVAERDGIVTISCRSAVWTAELSMLSETLLERLNSGLGEGPRVKRLRFTTGPR